MKKRLFSLALALLVVFPMCVVTAAADWKENYAGRMLSGQWEGDFYVSLNRITGNERTLYAYAGTANELVIPDNIEEILEIDFESSSQKSQITRVTIPNSVTYIGESAFNNFTGLTSVTIPNSVTEIHGCAFGNCTNLTSVTIGNSVTEIGWRAFEYCTSLTSVTIPDSVTEIGESAFKGCTSLTSITIPNSVTAIGEFTFEDCPELVIFGEEMSYAQRYAEKENIPFQIIATTNPGPEPAKDPTVTTKETGFPVAAVIAVVAVVVIAAVVVLGMRKKGTANVQPMTGSVTCSCGAVNPTSAAFCSKCGKPVIVPGRCSCGHQNDPEAQFCQKCGKPLNGGEG